MKIGLFFKYPDRMVGCWKVIDNLIRGLKELNIDVSENQVEKMTGCLQGIDIFKQKKLPPNTLIGPEIMVLPTEMSWAWNFYKNWVQPSQWVVDYMKQFPNVIKDCKLSVWPVGIDTERFTDKGRGKWLQDCFIYYKNVTHQTPKEKLNQIINILTKLGITYRILSYGNYSEDDKIECIKKCKFGIYLAGTESQGIAYMEMLSAGIPMLIIDEQTFLYSGWSFTNKNVSSAPYFDDNCGIKTSMEKFEDDIKIMMNKLNTFNPRKYIVENHTLKMGAEKYINILRGIK